MPDSEDIIVRCLTFYKVKNKTGNRIDSRPG